MKTSTTLIIVLITTTVSNFCFAMQPSANAPRPKKAASLEGVAQMSNAKGEVFSNIHKYFSPQESKNTHETSKLLDEVNSIIERKLIINLNEDSLKYILSRIKKSDEQILSLTITSTSEMEYQSPTQTQEQISTIVSSSPFLKELTVHACLNAAAGITQALIKKPNTLQNLKKLTLPAASPRADEITTIALHCPNLEELNVSGCHQAPSGIVNALALNKDGNRINPDALQKLTKLNLCGSNAAADEITSIVLRCPRLEELDASRCNQSAAGITTALKANPEALKKLKKLNLSNCNHTADQIKSIAIHCTLLEELSVVGCENAPTGIAQALAVNQNGRRVHTQALQQLKKLILKPSNPTADEITSIVLHCPRIEDLDVERCENAPAGIAAALAQKPRALQQLTTLNLGSCNPTAAQITSIIRDCHLIKELNVRNCLNAPTGIAAALGQKPTALQHLTTINLAESNPSATEMEMIIVNCHFLEELNTGNCANAPTGIASALRQKPTALQKLTKLNLSLSNPRPDEITTIALHSPALEKLNVSRCNQAPAGIAAALEVNPEALKKLTTLNLSLCDPTSDQIRVIAEHGLLLEELNVQRCSQATDGIAQALALNENGDRINSRALQQLKKLYLNQCNPTVNQIRIIVQECPLLEEVDAQLCENAPTGIRLALALDEDDNRINPHALQQLKKIFLTDISEEDVAILQNRLPGVKISR